MAGKIFAGILATSSIALGGAAAAETGRQEGSSQARASDRVPLATTAEVAAWAQERKDHCAPTFRERLAATRNVLRSYPTAVRDYERDYERQMPWFVSHCSVNEAQSRHGTSRFLCAALDGRPPGLTVLGTAIHHQFVVERATEPPLGFSETLMRENAQCVSRDPVSLSFYGMRPRSDGWRVPKLVRELGALVPPDPHNVPTAAIEDLVHEVGQRVHVIEVLCFGSKTATCSNARVVLGATAATRTEMERIADGQRGVPAKAASVTFDVHGRVE